MDGRSYSLIIVAICVAAWVLNNWIRARHGFSVSDDFGRNIEKSDPAAERQVALLTNENERLTQKVGRLEERIGVLERIATDPAVRTAHEIEALRDR